ncbi:DUF6053 domain-containing protein [Lysobacter enzymogenes]|uniref:DUF6053 domain-containing protein n=1 Tax=Lysobacter enzymogenes TaxID=69 RepID=UPI003D188BFD
MAAIGHKSVGPEGPPTEAALPQKSRAGLALQADCSKMRREPRSWAPIPHDRRSSPPLSRPHSAAAS